VTDGVVKAGSTRDAQVSSDQVRIVLRPIGSPLPLAFAAFGIGSFVFGLQQLGVFDVEQARSVSLLLVVFMAPLQGVAALLSFYARETLAATGLALLALSWPATYEVMHNLAPGATSSVLGCFYLAVSGFLLVLSAPAIAGKPLIGALIIVGAARLLLSGIYELNASAGLERASGVVGLVITAIGLYGALALGLEDVQHRTVLPVGRRGEARIAFEGTLAEQSEPLEHEAGVRRQL
jgi:succinate-acetate transporter protein